VLIVCWCRAHPVQSPFALGDGQKPAHAQNLWGEGKFPYRNGAYGPLTRSPTMLGNTLFASGFEGIRDIDGPADTGFGNNVVAYSNGCDPQVTSGVISNAAERLRAGCLLRWKPPKQGAPTRLATERVQAPEPCAGVLRPRLSRLRSPAECI
jgi:hypothetical protein